MQSSMRHVVLLLGLCAALLLPGLGELPVERTQELRVALTARAMDEGGSWLLPTYRGELRLQKPPLMYWLVAASLRLFGDPTSSVVVRLPSVLAGMLLILLVYGLGRRVLGRRRALFAAMVAASSLLFVRHARLAETDVLQTAAMTMSTLCLFFASSRHASRGWWAAAGLGAGIGFITKGPASVVIPLATLALFALTSRRRISLAGAGFGLLITALIAVPWYAYIAWSQAVEPLARASISSEMSALLVKGGHPGSWFYYALRLPILMLPWGPLLPVAVWNAARRAWRHDGVRFCLCWLAAAFLLLSFLKNKQAHYAMLLLPPSALLVGWLWSKATLSRRWPVIFVRSVLIGLGAAVAFMVVRAFAGGGINGLVGVGVFGLFVMGGLLFARRGMLERRGILAVALAVVFATAARVGTTRIFEPRDVAVPHLAARLRPVLSTCGNVHASGRHLAKIEFYAGTQLLGHPDAPHALAASQPGDGILLVTSDAEPVHWEPSRAEMIWTDSEQGIRLSLFRVADH